jgi:hypothetical protein
MQQLTTMGAPPPPTPLPGGDCNNLWWVCLPTANWRLKTLKQLVNTRHKSLSHTDECSQSLSSLRCWVTFSNSGCSSAPGLTSSQAGGHLTQLPTLLTLPCQDWFACPIDPRDGLEQKTLFLAVALLQCDMAVVADCIENTASNSSFITACKHGRSQVISTELLPSNGCVYKALTQITTMTSGSCSIPSVSVTTFHTTRL